MARESLLNVPTLEDAISGADPMVFEQIQKALASLTGAVPPEAFLTLHHIGNAMDPFTKAAEQQQADWIKLSKQIAEGMKRFDDALQKSDAIGRYGWTIPMEATAQEVISMVDWITDEASADAAFVWYFTHTGEANLKVLVKNTVSNPALVYWKPAIEEAIECLQEKKYRACIALLLPIVDGLCAQLFSVPEFQKWRVRKKFFNDRLQALRADSVEKQMWQSFIGFAETLFQEVDFANPPALLNRHVLLHGRGIPQAKLEDCLRLLQVLETITDLPL